MLGEHPSSIKEVAKTTGDGKNTTQKRQRIIFLDYMRVFAFASVVAGHKFIPYIDKLLASPSCPDALKAILGFLHPFVFAGGAGVAP
jgi:hypothetical protein